MNDITFPYKDKSIGLHNGVHRPNYSDEGLTDLQIIEKIKSCVEDSYYADELTLKKYDSIIIANYINSHNLKKEVKNEL